MTESPSSRSGEYSSILVPSDGRPKVIDLPSFHLPLFTMGMSLLVGDSKDQMSAESRREKRDQMGPISEKIRRTQDWEFNHQLL